MSTKNILRSLKQRNVRVKMVKAFFVSAICAAIIFRWKSHKNFAINHYIAKGNRNQTPGIRQLATTKTLQGKSIVLLVADQRSGSTVVGEIFNQNPSAFYLFEPLFPFSKDCKVLEHDRIELLGDLLQCDFDKMVQAYKHAFALTKFSDKDAECVNHNICFDTSHQPLLKKYASLCKSNQLGIAKTNAGDTKQEPTFEPDSKTCGFPLNASLMGDLCRTSDVVALKVLRSCSLQSIEKLLLRLNKKGMNVLIVHLVRDPRAIVSSRVSLRIDGIRLHSAQSDIDLLCDRYKANVNYIENLKSAAGTNFISSDRYLRVRHEDFTLRPQVVAGQIYKFIGREMPGQVAKFIFNSHQSTSLVMDRIEREDKRAIRQKGEIREYTKNKQILHQMNNPFGTIRDPSEVLKRWRTELPYDTMQLVQRRCGDVLPKLGYKVFNSKVDQVNLTMPFY